MRIKIFSIFVCLLFSILALNGKTVDVLRVISSAAKTPTYVRFDELPSIKYTEKEIIVSTKSVRLTFDFISSPSISFVNVEEETISDIINISIDDISSSKNIIIYNMKGQKVDNGNLPSGNYIIKTPNQTFKIFKK